MFRTIKGWVFQFTILAASISTAQADQYRVLNEGPEALQARIDFIQQAKISIDLSYYRWGNDILSRQVLGLLRDAAEKRNIQVRVIVDSAKNEIPPATLRYLARSGVVIKEYLPFSPLNARTWFHRMHNKLMIIDGRTLLVGGRNIVGGYFSPPPTEKFVDRDALVRGEAVTKAVNYFNQLWSSPYVQVRYGRFKGQAIAEAEQQIEEALKILTEASNPALNTGTDWFEGVSETSPVTFLHDDLKPGKHRKPVRDGLLELANNARESIVIEVGYLMVTQSLLKVFDEAIRRGVQIRILTNSMRSNDVPFAQAGHLAYRRRLVRMGIEVWEYMSDATLHVKSAVIDGRIVVIGSYNLDPVSDHLNTETVTYIEDERIAQEVLDSMEQNLEMSARIDSSGRPQGYRRRFPGVPWSKVASTQFLRYFLVPVLRALN